MYTYVSDEFKVVDKVSEYWEIDFAAVKHGRIVFARVITNDNDTDKDSLAWNLTINCAFAKFK